MRKRLGFRVLLPAGNLLLFVALCILGSTTTVVAVLQSEGTVSWDPHYPFSSLLSTPRLIGIALNAPAFLLASLIVALTRVPDSASANMTLALMYPFIALFWYLAGRWLDRRFGHLPDAVRTTPFWLLIASGISTGILLIWAAYRGAYFLNGGREGWHGETPIAAATAYGLAAWLCLWEVMLIAAIKEGWKITVDKSRYH